MIEFRNVRPTPLTENGVLKTRSQVFGTEGSFSFAKNYFVTAPSGKGKSTFIHLMYGLRSDYDGDILIDTKNIRTFDADTWASVRQKKMAIVFQDLRLFLHLTARENLLLKLHAIGDTQQEAANVTISDLEAWVKGMTGVFAILYVTNVLHFSVTRYGALVAIQMTTSILVSTKHAALRPEGVKRAYCPTQYKRM